MVSDPWQWQTNTKSQRRMLTQNVRWNMEKWSAHVFVSVMYWCLHGRVGNVLIFCTCTFKNGMASILNEEHNKQSHTCTFEKTTQIKLTQSKVATKQQTATQKPADTERWQQSHVLEWLLNMPSSV